MEGNERFAMGRERDITDAVKKHYGLVFKLAMINPPEHLFLKIRVYWTKNKASEIEAFDLPEYVLQDVLQNKCLDDILYRNGQKTAADRTRPKGVPDSAQPIGITISAETMLMNDSTPHGSSQRKVKGFPVFLVAGRTATGRQHFKLFPIALIDSGPLFEHRVIGLTAPEEINKKIEAVKELAEDFMAPFFDGYNEGGTRESFVNAS